MRKGHNYLLLCPFRIPFVCDHSLAVLTGSIKIRERKDLPQ